jgi:hypothetical protein
MDSTDRRSITTRGRHFRQQPNLAPQIETEQDQGPISSDLSDIDMEENTDEKDQGEEEEDALGGLGDEKSDENRRDDEHYRASGGGEIKNENGNVPIERGAREGRGAQGNKTAAKDKQREEACTTLRAQRVCYDIAERDVYTFIMWVSVDGEPVRVYQPEVGEGNVMTGIIQSEQEKVRRH